MKIILAIQISFLLVTAVCWCTNLYRFATCNFEETYKAEIIYGIGIFAPTCYVTAWMDIED